MTPFEQLAVGYFVLVLAAAVRRFRPRALLYGIGALLLVIVARFVPWPFRAWLPHLYLLLGYWIPAASVAGPHPPFEEWLARADARLPRVPVRWPVPATLLELAYLICYLLVPAGLSIVLLLGSSEDVVFFWLSTLGSGYASYLSLPWAAARPPRLMTAGAMERQGGVASLNAALLGRMSHQYVTFPSGHVAVSLGVAAGVWRVCPAGGTIFGVVALLVAVAAVAGRYHYAVDVLAGLLVGALVPLMASVG